MEIQTLRGGRLIKYTYLTKGGKMENGGYYMIDPDILLLAIVNMAKGVKSLIGDKCTKAVLRDAGRQAGPKLLESLMWYLPETLTQKEALRKTCLIPLDLGFADRIEKVDGEIKNERKRITLIPESVERGRIVYKY